MTEEDLKELKRRNERRAPFVKWLNIISDALFWGLVAMLSLSLLMMALGSWFLV